DGNSNTSLLPPSISRHLRATFPSNDRGAPPPTAEDEEAEDRLSCHCSAPTHGCTFQPTSSRTPSRSASWPEMSVIWYLGLTFLMDTIPGGASGSGFEGSGFFFLVSFPFAF
ncbi:MAG: hypothetical protein LQ340_003970, partial [Diploschistes diacapsis]